LWRWLCTKYYYYRDHFYFPIVNFPFTCFYVAIFQLFMHMEYISLSWYWNPNNWIKSANVGGWDPINRIKSAVCVSIFWEELDFHQHMSRPLFRIRFFLANNCFVFPRTYWLFVINKNVHFYFLDCIFILDFCHL
jgi:hypothetical protein